MATDDLQLQSRVRLVHIGPHKTGTTAVQGAFQRARERLAAEGVFYPGKGRQPLWSILAVTRQPALVGDPLPEIAYWHNLIRSIDAAGDKSVVVSSEFFADADDAAARRVVRDLGPRVHVAVTLRPLAKILPSQWQQYMQNGYCMPYLDWLEGILSDPPRTPTPGFWRRHRHDKLIARWAAAAGPENLTVIVVDESDRLMLLRTFTAMLGLPNGVLVPDQGVANRSLTLAEAEVVRRLNEEFRRSEWPGSSYSRFMRYGAVEKLKSRQPGPDETPITTPVWALKRAAGIGAEVAQNIASLGVRVVGDLATLSAGSSPGDASSRAAGLSQTGNACEDAELLLPAEAAAAAIIGAFQAGGVAGLKPAEVLREVDAKSMTRVLAQRGRLRMRRTLRLRGTRKQETGRQGTPRQGAGNQGARK
ncbi:MAG TPA: hypothetical protein VMC03_08820 [Streptosporangiaceae bacterium]|nr:hypothetical protein [Streptosporangiaceae bacterium]